MYLGRRGLHVHDSNLQNREADLEEIIEIINEGQKLPGQEKLVTVTCSTAN